MYKRLIIGVIRRRIEGGIDLEELQQEYAFDYLDIRVVYKR